jgi:MFS family permease
VLKNRRAIVALLTGLNLVNYVDRFLVNAMSPRIKESLSLSDAETGLVVSAFMYGYFLTSPLFGWLGDRFRRKELIAAGVAVWSIATIASGFATSLAGLVAARVLVGVGEASYATLSPTIIDDLASDKEKNRFLAIFYVAIPVGSALGFTLGGLLETAYGWRSAFFIAGAPGLALAIATLWIAEPIRPRVDDALARARGGYAALLKNRRYVLAVGGYVAQTFALGGFTAWAPHFLYRKSWGESALSGTTCLELDVANFWFGAITVVTGLLGTAIGGKLSDRWPGEDRIAVAIRVCAWSSVIATPLALAAILAPSAPMFFIFLGLAELAIFTSVAPTNAAVLGSVPPALRATAMAASIFAIHLLGDLISPPLIGGISDAYGDAATSCSGARGLTVGMYFLPVALALSAIVWWRGGKPAIRPDTA